MKLSLRDLFWLVALVAMSCAWWTDRARLSQDASMGRLVLELQADFESDTKAALATLPAECVKEFESAFNQAQRQQRRR